MEDKTTLTLSKSEVIALMYLLTAEYTQNADSVVGGFMKDALRGINIKLTDAMIRQESKKESHQ